MMMRLVVGVVLCVVFGSAAHGAGVYKWTDENGKVHYSDKPPADTESESITVSTQRDEHTAQRMRNIQKQTAETAMGRREAEAEEAKQESEQAARAAHCEASKRKLEELQRPRAQILNEQGEREYLEEAQRAAWIRIAEGEIAKHCQ